MPRSTPDFRHPPIVHDVSRLVWRLWSGRHPTGIDRVCLAYLDHYADRSLAMLQWKEKRVVLNARHSKALFDLLLNAGGRLDRKRLALCLATALVFGKLASSQLEGLVYLNTGHTGLNSPTLPQWLASQKLRPIYLIHDLIPITHPQFCRKGEEKKHRQRMTHALESAAGVIVNSAETGKDLVRFAGQQSLPIPPQIVAHLGIEPILGTKRPAPDLQQPYFLAIGTIEARKNHMTLMRAWDMLRTKLGSKTPPLVILGQRGWEAQDVFDRLDHERHEQGKIIELSNCGDAELAAWIDGACAVLMPSHVEGYGLPVLEALARGTPVIASDLAVYHEIAGGVPLLIDPAIPEVWAEAVQSYSVDGPDRKRQIAALGNFHAPSWEDHFGKVDRWLKGFERGPLKS